jgi:outer membrane immunogenic protein
LKKLLLMCIAAGFFSGETALADMPTMPALYAESNWTGLYVGGNGGWAWDSTSWRQDVTDNTTGGFGGNGGLIGGTIGYNFQTGPWVFGIEGDADSAFDLKPTKVGVCPDLCQTDIHWLATARGRVGYASNAFLTYVTGGAAWAHLENTIVGTPIPPASVTGSGWTAGFGLEVIVAPNWTVKTEYLHVEIGGTPVCPAASCGADVNSTFQKMEVVRTGLNYKF